MPEYEGLEQLGDRIEDFKTGASSSDHKEVPVANSRLLNGAYKVLHSVFWKRFAFFVLIQAYQCEFISGRFTIEKIVDLEKTREEKESTKNDFKVTFDYMKKRSSYGVMPEFWQLFKSGIVN